MLLTIDIGNTNIVLGIFQDDNLIKYWRIVTRPDKTEDEYGILIYNLYQAAKIEISETKQVIISSVVPAMVRIMEALCAKYFHLIPIFVGPGVRTGMPIRYDNPHEVGADRIVNAVAAFERYRQSVIVVDF